LAGAGTAEEAAGDATGAVGVDAAELHAPQPVLIT